MGFATITSFSILDHQYEVMKYELYILLFQSRLALEVLGYVTLQGIKLVSLCILSMGVLFIVDISNPKFESSLTSLLAHPLASIFVSQMQGLQFFGPAACLSLIPI